MEANETPLSSSTPAEETVTSSAGETKEANPTGENAAEAEGDSEHKHHHNSALNAAHHWESPVTHAKPKHSGLDL